MREQRMAGLASGATGHDTGRDNREGQATFRLQLCSCGRPQAVQERSSPRGFDPKRFSQTGIGLPHKALFVYAISMGTTILHALLARMPRGRPHGLCHNCLGFDWRRLPRRWNTDEGTFSSLPGVFCIPKVLVCGGAARFGVGHSSAG